MALAIRPLRDKSNEAILNAIRRDASLDYQRRIPEATKASQENVMKSLSNNRPEYNEFVDALVNKIGLTFGRNMIWSNPMAIFKMGMLEHGDTIEEYGMGLLQAHTYDADREALEKEIFGTELPDVQASFHKQTRKEYYKVSVNENLLLRAFLTPGGISDFTTKLMQTPATSDAWDEFLNMCNLFNLYEKNDGFYKVNVGDVRSIASDADTAKDVIRKTRSLTGAMQFPSTKYNAAGLPTFAKPDELILFATPDYQAAVDVEALAGAFNPDKLSQPRIITIPEDQFNIDGAQAILTTKDFFVMADTVIQTEQVRNPVKMMTNYFLHHHQIISASRFVPAVLFTTKAGTESIKVSTPVASVAPIKVTNRENVEVSAVTRGELYNVIADAVTNPAGGPNDAVMLELSGATAPRTRITQDGVLHVAGTEGATTLTIKGTATWVDTTGVSRAGKTTTKTVTVTGVAVDDWGRTENAAAPAMMSMRSMPVEETPEDAPKDAPVDYSTKTNDELKSILAERGLDTSGVKTVLIDRLTEDDGLMASDSKE